MAVNPGPVFLQLWSIGSGVVAIAIWIGVFAIAVCQDRCCFSTVFLQWVSIGISGSFRVLFRISFGA